MTKRYGTFAAADVVDLSVTQGEFVTILGPSGSGKTTLLSLIAGLNRPTSGRICIGGRDVTNATAQERNIGLVFLTVPLVMMMLGVAIREFDQRIEQVAWSLGASWGYTMRKVVLPNLAPSVFAAWIFAFIGSFDEVIVTSFIAGKYETVPKKMFNELALEVNPTITAVAALLIAFTVLALAAVAFVLGRAGKLKETGV